MYTVPGSTPAAVDRTRAFLASVGSGRVLLAALALRILLSPLNHTWESQTWWNVMSELGGEPNPVRAVALPYERMQEMGAFARGSGQGLHYEYWAYPPVMLYLWWPVARFWEVAAGPLEEQFAAPDTFTARPLPLPLSLLMKVPTMAADLVVAALLTRLASGAVGRWYLFHPYVLLVGLWTFDPVMLACLLAGLATLRSGRWAAAGALIGVGAAVKFTAGLALPAIVFAALRQEHRPWRSATAAAAAFGLTFAVLCAPVVDGLRYVLQFHSDRPGGGLSWHSIWDAISWNDPYRDVYLERSYISPQIGAFILTGLLLLACWAAWTRRLDPVRASLLLLVAFLAGSKLVNEVYPLPALTLAAVVAHADPSAANRARLALLGVVPLAFTLVNVPIWGFFLPPAEALGWTTLEAARDFRAGYVQTYQVASIGLTAVGFAFQLACAWSAWQLVRAKSPALAPDAP